MLSPENKSDLMTEGENKDQNSSDTMQQSIKQRKLERYMEQLKLEQSLPLGLLGGVAASIIAALLWAIVTVITKYQIGYMAIAVGFIVGHTVRITGKGIDKTFGVIGALLALIGCIAGNFFSIIGFLASNEGLGYFEALTMLDYSYVPEIMLESFSPMDLLFYGIAVYEGYNFSFRKITEEELATNVA